MKQLKSVCLLLLIVLSFIHIAFGSLARDFRYVEIGPLTLSSDSDFVTFGFPGSGTQNDPYIIEGYNITGEGPYGIFVGDEVSVYFIIRQCFIKGFITGIVISDAGSPLAIIEDNSIYSENDAIDVANVHMVYIQRNLIYGSILGINVGTVYDGLAIVNNSMTNVNSGIYLATIKNGLILNNTILAEQYGISTDIEITDTEICWNTIRGVFMTGITVDGTDSHNVIIHHNVVYAGDDFGYYINSLGSQNIQNPDIYWYDQSTNEGNYWSNWEGTGSYPIVDLNNNHINDDLYPLSSPPVPTEKFPSAPTSTPEDNTSSSTDSGSDTNGDTDIVNSITSALPLNLIPIISALFAITELLLLSRKRKY